MIKIKVTTPNPSWPLARQTPASSAKWGDCQFFINKEVKDCDWWIVGDNLVRKETVNCPAHNTIFIAGDPPTVRKYNGKFLRQFNWIITSDVATNHPNVLNKQQALPWFIGQIGPKFSSDGKNFENTMTYDDFKKDVVIPKEHSISTIVSTKHHTEGHQHRLSFLEYARDKLGSLLHRFGAGNNVVADKWDAIAPYKYHLVLENSSIKDYWSEKLSDAFLGEAYPIYYGCPNIYEYFPKTSLSVIDINRPEQAMETILEVVNNNYFEKRKKDILEAKRLVMNEYNFFPFVANFIKNNASSIRDKTQVTIRPEINFSPLSRRIKYSVRKALKNTGL